MSNLSANISFPSEEEKTCSEWTSSGTFMSQCRLSSERRDPEYTFYDGPPFATGLPHYGHILAGTIKDTVTRYAAMTGYYVERRAGWDCHGLPVEYEIDQKLNITHRDQVLAMGIKQYNAECRGIVTRYTKEWESTVTRLGRWIDFKNDYKTMNPDFMESVWWVFKELFKKDMVYQGYKVMPFSTACGTPLSNFEAGLNYKDVNDPAVVVSFPVVGEPGAFFLAWTTTPWTLPSNLALCVHPELKYVRCRDVKSGNVYILAEARLPQIYDVMSSKKWKPEMAAELYEILSTCVGKDLVGLKYEPLFDYFATEPPPPGAGPYFRVLCDNYVTADSGTGVVHQAPAFGEDDYRVCLAAGLIFKGQELPCPVDANGIFTEKTKDLQGKHVKAADEGICSTLKARGRLVQKKELMHSYPFCWRSDTPLIYKAVPSWFVKVEEMKEDLLRNNEATYWVPNVVKEGRFQAWLRDARDWAISRNRFWGTPIPVWANADFSEVVCIGSIDELAQLSGVRVTDLHRETVDDITIPSAKGGPPLRRIDEVFDCWFESGAMPYAQKHYPFEKEEEFQKGFPADFIAEGLDQTRGWFYTLMVLSTALFNKPPFKNLIVNGLVLAGDGKKMSKRLKNYPDPTLVIDKYGADALRLYLINSPVVRAEPLKFQEAGVLEVVKSVFLPWYNAFRFFMQSVERKEGVFVPDANMAAASTNAIDVWIMADCQGLIKFVHEEMRAYRLYTVVPRLVDFVGQLTNWYVRLNRERLKAEGEDSFVALQVLHSILVDMTLLLSPFTPFITEFFYQHLRKFQPSYALRENGGGAQNPVMFGKSDSVHFLRLPEYDASRLNAVAVKAMGVLQTVVELGRLAREKRLLSLKQPVKSLVICVTASGADVVENLKTSLDSYIRSELNVWDVKYVTQAEEHEWVTISLLPNLAILGKKLGKNMGPVTKYLKEMKHEAAKAAIAAGQLTVEGVVIDFKTEVIVQYKYAREGDKVWEGVVNEAGSVMIAIDTTQDEALLSAGKSRELITTVQKLRKSAKLTLSDKVDVFYREAGNGVRSAIAANMGVFEAKFGADSIPLPVDLAEKHSVVIATSEFETVEGNIIGVELRTPVLCMRDDLSDLLKFFLASKEKVEKGYTLTVDGVKFELKEGVDYWPSATAKARSTKKI